MVKGTNSSAPGLKNWVDGGSMYYEKDGRKSTVPVLLILYHTKKKKKGDPAVSSQETVT